MIKGAQKVLLCVDHTKLGRKSVLPLCGVDSIDTVITDEGAPAEILDSLRAQGVEVVIAPIARPAVTN
jgi:DeoR/GlpR family transcriptional regulator of sugar metabolism